MGVVGWVVEVSTNVRPIVQPLQHETPWITSTFHVNSSFNSILRMLTVRTYVYSVYVRTLAVNVGTRQTFHDKRDNFCRAILC